MKNWILSLSVAGTLIFLASCGQNEKAQNVELDQIADVTLDSDLSKGFQLLESNCFSCHSPNAKGSNRVAPPMFAIKKHYIGDGVNKEQFTGSLINYINDPSEENSEMPGAIEKFGVMPKMEFSKEELELIANYIYETELERPGWYQKNYQQEKRKHMAKMNEDLSYEDRGRKYAMSTKSILGKNLLGAIKSNGTEKALEFCNIKAIALTDSMANVLGATIRRVSDKNRNPLNAANETELEYINAAHLLLANGGKLTPQLQEINGKMVGYYPIMTNAMCLQCHGIPNEQIRPATLERIALLYPEDLATGYGENELRGIWVVEMAK